MTNGTPSYSELLRHLRGKYLPTSSLLIKSLILWWVGSVGFKVWGFQVEDHRFAACCSCFLPYIFLFYISLIFNFPLYYFNANLPHIRNLQILKIGLIYLPFTYNKRIHQHKYPSKFWWSNFFLSGWRQGWWLLKNMFITTGKPILYTSLFHWSITYCFWGCTI